MFRILLFTFHQNNSEEIVIGCVIVGLEPEKEFQSLSTKAGSSEIEQRSPVLSHEDNDHADHTIVKYTEMK